MLPLRSGFRLSSRLLTGSCSRLQRWQHGLTPGKWLLLAVLSGTLGLGCTPQRTALDNDGETPTPPGTEAPIGTLRLSPELTDLTVSGQNQTVQFKATSSKLGDVSSQVTWTLSDATLGSLSKGVLTVPGNLDHGGTTKVYASLRGVAASAVVNVRLIAPDVLEPSAPANAKDYFSGSSGGAPPTIAYPFDHTMMAPNVLQVTLQWRTTASYPVYRITASGPTYERSFYVGSSVCASNQCTYNLDDKAWSTLSHSSLGKDTTVTVSGAMAPGDTVGESQPIQITFAPEDTRGGLYYFSPTIQGIKRVPLGASKPVDFITNGDETGCAGCHAVSRDGKQVAVEFGSGQTSVGSTVVDGAMPRMRNFPLKNSIAWNFAWFNPTGDKLITNWSGKLTVRDSKTGGVLETVPQNFIGSNYGGAMPEWSPDGKWLAFVRIMASSSYDFQLVNSGEIVVMPYNNGAFGPAVTVVPMQAGAGYHFWPSWSPDSKWLVFNTFDCSGSCQQYNAVKTRLRLVQAIDDTGQPNPGATPIELEHGTHIKHQSNNWPKFAPFLQGGRYVFVVYSARYGWGFNQGSQPQLFMFGLDLDKAKKGEDPSYQPVWLPFQDRNTGNHSAIWTTDVACALPRDCPGEFRCVSGMCVPNIG